LNEVWNGLGDPDRWVRYAARVALEERPVDQWKARALAESGPWPGLTALLALARLGPASIQPELVERVGALLGLDGASAGPTNPGPEAALIGWRALAVSFARSGRPSPEVVERVRRMAERRFPSGDARLDQALCEMLVYVESPEAVRRTVPLIGSAQTQNEKVHYLLLLRGLRTGWTPEDRRTYFTWLLRAWREFHGANTLPVALKFIRRDAEATLTPAERTALADLWPLLDAATAGSAPGSTAGQEKPAAAPAVRKFVKEWALSDFAEFLGAPRGSEPATLPDPARGQWLFTEAGCAACHRFGRTGGVVGPDLSAVGSRFDRRALLESILEPSRVVSEVYRTTTVITRGGDILEGRLLAEDEQAVTLGLNALDPASAPRSVPKASIESRRLSELSPMPSGLVNTLAKEEVVELLRWLEAGPR
jgi:putative heme-binding domain-containing protein